MDVPPDFIFHRPDGSPIPTDGTGRWYERVCTDLRELEAIAVRYPDTSYLGTGTETRAFNEVSGATRRRPVYLRKAAPALVEEARSRLVLPTLRPRFAPASPWTYVNHPTALWLEGITAEVLTATAAVPGVSVSVTATPEEVLWDLGDGEALSCPGLGRPSDGTSPPASSDCAYVWGWSSVGQPDSAYQVSATVFWRVRWSVEGASGGGDLGVIPQRTETFPVRVAEIQAINVPPES